MLWTDRYVVPGKCYEHATLISYNNYPSWYNSNPPSFWNEAANAVRAGGPNGAATTHTNIASLFQNGATKVLI